MGLFSALWELSLVEKGTCEDGEQFNLKIFSKFFSVFLIFVDVAEKSARGAGAGPAVPGDNEESCPEICHSGARMRTEA